MTAPSPLHRRLVLGLLALVTIAALGLAGNLPGAAAPAPQDNAPFATLSLPPEALSWSADPADKPQRHPRLDSTLDDLAGAAEESVEAALALARARSLRLSGDRVHVQVVTHAPGLQGALAAMAMAGGQVTKVGADSALIQGWLPITALAAVAAHEDVYLIRRPAELVLDEYVEAADNTTEGLQAINGLAWHAAGHRGAGVRIAVIDGGFMGYQGLLGVDLPASVTVRNFIDGETDAQVNGTTRHGTACAEIIYDIAPDAALYLVKISTNLDLQEAVAWLMSTHQVDIISTSYGWYNLTPGDGTGEFADLVQVARDSGILWVTSAGNDRESHWGGPYYDPNDRDTHYYNATQNVNFFGPGDGDLYLIPEGYRLSVFLRWDDWTAVDQDYDLLLLRWSGSAWSVIARSDDHQNGGPGQSPTEYVTAVASGSATGYGFVIARYDSDRAVNLEVFAPSPGARLDEILHARSLINLADAPGALTVAALDVVAPYPQEPYSSEGPTNGPGGAETGGFIKPNLAGFANVSTESYGLTDKFNGTSAAAPHVAGAAALVKGAYPAHSPNQVQLFLEGRAIDMGPAGLDTIYGHGRLYLGAPPSAETTATPTATRTTTLTPTRTPSHTPTATTTSPPAATSTVTPTRDPGALLKVYLPLVMKQGPAGIPTPTPTPTETTEPVQTPTATVTTQPGRWMSNGPYGGGVWDLAMSISNPDVLYAVMDGAGLFKTISGGDSWSQVASPPEGISRIYVVPNNPAVVYAGTANGIYKSVDGGATWTHKGLTGILVRTIAIDPSNPQVVYLGAAIGSSTGVVFKSTDAGEIWQQKFSAENLWVNTLLVDTTTPDRIYLGASGEPQGVGGLPQGLRISSDGGDSWTSRKVTTLSSEAVFALAMTPMGYTSPVLYASERSAMYKSIDGGLTWIKLVQTSGDHSLAVDMQNPNVVYAGGGGGRSLPNSPTSDWYPYNLGSKSTLRRSADNGATWTRKDDGLPGEVATSIVIDPRNGRVFVGLRSAGVYRSTDDGSSWQFASHGITATNIQDLAVDPAGSGRVIAAIEGPSHPMAVTAGAGEPWAYLIGDDKPTNVGAVTVDPTHPGTWYAGDGLIGNWRWVYTFRSTDAGNAWTANQLLYKTEGPVGQVVYHRVFAMAVDPGNAGTVLAALAEQRTAYGGVYKSSDAGASWSRTLPDWATSLAFDPASPGRVYAGAMRYGKVFRSSDSGTTWTQIGGSTLEALRVYDIAVTLNGHVYVATNGGLQKWNGAAWSAATGLPQAPTIALATDRSSNPGAIYVGTTTHGVYVSRDDGATWTPFNEELGNLYVTELEISNGPTKTLHAGTAYGGVWSIDISSKAQ